MPRAAKEKEQDFFEPPSPEEVDFDDFLQEVGANVAVIHVLRMKPDGSRPQVGKTTMDAIREDAWEYLRATYGPGKYLLLFKGADRNFRGSKVLEVEASGGNGNGSNNGSNNGSGKGEFNEEKIPFHDRLMLYHLMKPQAPVFDMGAMMAGMAAMMTAMRPPEGKTIDPLETFRTIMTLYQSMVKKDEKDPLTQLREVAGVIKEFTPDGGGGDSMWGVVGNIGKELIDKGSTVLSQFANRPVVVPAGPQRVAPGDVRFAPARQPAQIPAGAAPGAPATLPGGLPEGTVMAGSPGPVAATGPAPVPAPGPAATAPAGAAPGTDENLQRWLMVQIGTLKQKARAGKDPGYWIDYFFENAEEPGCQAVTYAIRQGATYENLIAFDPEIGQDMHLSEWFRYLYNGLRNGRMEDGEWIPGLLQGAMDSGGQGGHPRDNSANASVVPTRPVEPADTTTRVVIPDTDIH